MGRPKGGKNKTWNPDEKMRIVNRYINGESTMSRIANEEKIPSGMLANWTKKFKECGIKGLQGKPGNKFAGIHRKKNLSEIEILEYENFKLKMENELLKKGLDPERVMYLAKKKKD